MIREPKRDIPWAACYRTGTDVGLALLIPLGFSTKPFHHWAYMATSYGLKSKYLFVTLDNKRSGKQWWNPRRWRLQYQVMHFGTSGSVLVDN